jgi:hypothetical protein
MNFQVQEKTVFFLNRLFYNSLILLSINLSPIALLGGAQTPLPVSLLYFNTFLKQNRIDYNS